jgi:hypothetical protein
MFVIDGNGLGPLSGKFVWFSLVKTDLNCSLRILALLWLSLFRNPCWFFSGATPINSWPLLLMYDHSLLLKPGKEKRKKTRIDIKDYKQKSSMKSGKQARNT